MSEVEEDRKNLDELYAYGMRWLEQLEYSLKEKDKELEGLRQDAATLSKAREKVEALAALMRRPENG